MANRIPITYTNVVNNYGNPLVENLKKKMSLGTERLRIGQQRDDVQKQLDALQNTTGETQEHKDNIAVKKAKLQEELSGLNSTGVDTKANDTDKEFYRYVRQRQEYYETRFPPISEKDGQTQDAQAEKVRMQARAEMMEMIINKYVDTYPSEVNKVLEQADANAGADRDAAVVGTVADEATGMDFIKEAGDTQIYQIVFTPTNQAAQTVKGVEEEVREAFADVGYSIKAPDKSVLGHDPNQPGASIFDVTDAEGQVNIRKVAYRGVIGAEKLGKGGVSAEMGASGFGGDAATRTHIGKRGYIPLYRDGDLIKPGERPKITDSSVAMALAGKNKKESQKIMAIFALKSAGAEFFFGSTNKEDARSKLFANADDRAKSGVNASIEFDITVTKTEQAVRNVSNEAAAAKKVDDMAIKLQKMAFREQCFLVDHYKPLVSYKHGAGVAATKSWGGLNNYTYFSAVDVNPALFTARVAGQPSLKPLFEITPAEFSQLLPKIKLYKRFPGKDALRKYSGKAGGKGGPNPKVLAELKKLKNKNKDPNGMIEVEIPFRINPTTQTINEIFANDKSRADGVGLKSFTFDFIGRNSFEVERNIVCKMELFFRNLEDLNSGSTLANFIDLILFGVSKKNPAANVNKFNQRVDYYHPDDYSMKAVVGWEVPPKSRLKHGLVKNKELVELLKRNVITLILNLTNHKINFSQDGSGTVEIDFIGAIEMRSFSNNLLATQKDETITDGVKTGYKVPLETLKANLRLEERKLAYRKGQHSNKPNDEPGGMDTLRTHIRHHQKKKQREVDFQTSADRVNNLREKINARETALSKATYSSFFEQLYNRPILYVDIDEGDDIGGVPGPSSILGLVSGRMVADDELAAAMRMDIPLFKNLQSNISVVPMGDADFQKKRDQLFESDKSSGRGASALGMQTQKDNKVQKERGPNDDDPKDVRKPKPASQEDIDKKMYFGDPTSSGKRRIYFTYVGTILEAGFQLVANNILGEVSSLGVSSVETVAAEMTARMMANRYMFGTMPFYDVREEKPVIVNITDLPISLNKVNAFWFNKVIRKSLSTYSLNQFIKDVVNDLIIPFFSARCYPKYPPDLRVKPMYSLLEARGFRGRDRVPKKSRITSISEIPKNPGFSFDNPTAKTYNYSYIYIGGSETIQLGSDVVQDAERGIYHFFIGLDRGLMKTAEFDRLDTAHQREMRSIGDENRISAQLRQPYKLNIKAFGNTLFRPGMYCYINPRIAGGSAKRKESLTYLMNLGGYGLITKVSNTITPGSFETQLDCVLSGISADRGRTSTLTSKPAPIDVINMTSTNAKQVSAEYERKKAHEDEKQAEVDKIDKTKAETKEEEISAHKAIAQAKNTQNKMNASAKQQETEIARKVAAEEMTVEEAVTARIAIAKMQMTGDRASAAMEAAGQERLAKAQLKKERIKQVEAEHDKRYNQKGAESASP